MVYDLVQPIIIADCPLLKLGDSLALSLGSIGSGGLIGPVGSVGPLRSDGVALHHSACASTSDSVGPTVITLVAILVFFVDCARNRFPLPLPLDTAAAAAAGLGPQWEVLLARMCGCCRGSQVIWSLRLLLLLLLIADAFERGPHPLVVLQLAGADTGDELAVGVEEVLFRDHDSDVFGRGVVVEVVGRRDGVFGGRIRVDGPDLGVDGRGLARHRLEHGVAAERVEVGARVGEGQLLRDGGERDRRMQREPSCCVSFVAFLLGIQQKTGVNRWSLTFS